KRLGDFGGHTMRIIIFLLTVSVFSCSGFPVYDYDLPVTEEALNASIARINSQSWSRNLYGVVRSRVMGVDTWDSDTYGLDLRFSIRETVCAKASGRDPSTCDFQSGPFVPTASCRSVVEVSGGLIANITVRCHRSTFSSESMSSEEMMHMPMRTPDRWGSTHREAFPSRGRGSSRGDWNKPSYFNPDKRE
ncbi:SPP24 protein, partial [Loxia curvirostra]|nr:SPP24 protein [Loxia curvirostra]